ncbi:hypothetical protein GF352_02725 [archaeon]|nr:hypothetical protein [archaeon]
MIKAELMNSKEVKKLQSIMDEQYGTHLEGFFYKGSKNRIYLGTRFTRLIEFKKVNAEGVGLYIGRLRDDGFRPSIEGVQLLRPEKNVYELSKEQLWDWLRGYKITINTDYEGYCALSHQGEIIGPGKIKNKKVWNYVPKNRRIRTLIKKQVEKD